MSAYKMGKVTAVFSQGIEKQMKKYDLPMFHVKQQLDLAFDMINVEGKIYLPTAGSKALLIGTKTSHDVVVFNDFTVCQSK